MTEAPTTQRTITVLGAGAWGSTLAHLLAENGRRVSLWDRSREALERLARDGHPFGVPELKISPKVHLESELTEALMDTAALVFVVPSQALAGLVRSVARELYSLTWPPEPMLVLASKGLDIPTLSPLSELLRTSLPHLPLGVISGPCIAREVAQGVPTSIVAAGQTPEQAAAIRDMFVAPRLRIYTQGDLLGVELGGALKNVVAVAAGIGDGLGFGANTKSALLTRGLAEMARLAVAMGAQATTTYGLAGLGDLTVTCFSPHSRNRQFGELLGQGLTAEAARAKIGMVVEGEPTARAALLLAERHQVELPIAEAVVRVCQGEWTALEAVQNLMARDLKEEFGAYPPGLRP